MLGYFIDRDISSDTCGLHKPRPSLKKSVCCHLIDSFKIPPTEKSYDGFEKRIVLF